MTDGKLAHVHRDIAGFPPDTAIMLRCGFDPPPQRCLPQPQDGS